MIKIIKKIYIGSNVFFNKFDDYIIKDIDELNILSWQI